MRRLLRSTTLYLAVIMSVFTLAAPLAHAAPAPDEVGQALEIAPPVLNLRGNPGETVRGTISLRDVSPTPLLVTNEINDFTSQGEEGIPKLLLDPGEQSPYSMRTWF